MEVTSEDAVSALRKSISSGPGKGPGLTALFWSLFVASAETALIMLFASPIFMLGAFFYGMGIGAISFFASGFLLWAVLLRRRMRKGSPVVKSGMVLGDSYARHVLQYSNSSSAQGRRESNRAVVRGAQGPYALDLLSEPNQHVLIAGSSSSGKTTTLKSLLARASLLYGTGFLAIDWQGELEGFAEEAGASLWRVPGNFTLNIFRLNGMDPMQRSAMVEEGLMLALQLTQLQATRVRDALARLYPDGEPTLQSLWMELSQRRENYLIGYRLKAVERVIGAEPSEFWDNVMRGNTVLSLAGLNDNEKSLVTYFILQRICELFEKGSIGSKPRLLVAIDEAWQLMSRQQSFLKLPNAHEMLAEKIVRLGRKYGFGIITSTQQLEDLPNAFINSSSVIMLHSYRQQWRNNALSLNALDIEYARGAAQGECLVMDRLRSQMGQTWLDYVKVSPVSDAELERLRLNSNPIKPAELSAQESAISITGRHEVRKSRIFIPIGAPSPSEHAAMLAIYRNPGAGKARLVSCIKEKGWISSDATIYGYQGKPGVLEKLVSAGFAAVEEGRYGLTEQGKKWMDPEHIMANQSDKLGSEEHKRLMAKTIEKLHEENVLVITSSVKHSPDLISFPVSKAKKYLWDTANAMGYEIQTSARKDAIEMNEAKTGLPITWVAEDESVLEEIKRLTSQRDGYWFI
jgi:hypothetical protein